MQFKLWLQKEGLSGPGGGATMDDPNADMASRAKSDASKGVGAFPHIRMKDTPIAPQTSPTANYLDPKHRRMMKKKMKKN